MESLQNARATITKVTNAVSDAATAPMYEKIASRPWGAAAKASIQTSVAAIGDAVTSLHKVGSDVTLAAKTTPDTLDTSLLHTGTHDLEAMLSTLDKEYLGDIKTMK